MAHFVFLAQWSPTDSANLQDLHDWFSALFSTAGLDWGVGVGLTFGLGFLIVYALRRVFGDWNDGAGDQ